MGYSGGAQFSHRWTMTRPERVEHLIAVAAGWYTFPNPDLAFPYGLATAGRLRRVSFDPESFLAVPTTVLVGGEDRDSVNLRRNPRLDAQQGDTRVERARRWVLAMRMAARLYRVDANIAYQEVPGVDHDFHNFVARGHLLELVLAAILETPRSEEGDGNGVNDRAA
jgi:pimeloyl-ACP methyl ester carboxylesterase